MCASDESHILETQMSYNDCDKFDIISISLASMQAWICYSGSYTYVETGFSSCNANDVSNYLWVELSILADVVNTH